MRSRPKAVRGLPGHEPGSSLDAVALDAPQLRKLGLRGKHPVPAWDVDLVLPLPGGGRRAPAEHVRTQTPCLRPKPSPLTRALHHDPDHSTCRASSMPSSAKVKNSSCPPRAGCWRAHLGPGRRHRRAGRCLGGSSGPRVTQEAVFPRLAPARPRPPSLFRWSRLTRGWPVFGPIKTKNSWKIRVLPGFDRTKSTKIVHDRDRDREI